MAAAADPLPAGIAAFQAGDYVTAIAHLQQACAELGGDEQLQAQGWLVRAYVKAQQFTAARQLCADLAHSDRPKIRAWASQTLAQLPPPTPSPASSPEAPGTRQVAAPEAASATDSATDRIDPWAPGDRLPPETAEALLETGIKALRRDQFPEAIAALEDFARGSDETYRNYRWGLTSLVKAYSGHGQQDQAIALCHTLLNHPQESLQQWARDYLKKLEPTPAPTVAEPSTPDDGVAQNVGGDRPQPAVAPQHTFPSTYPQPTAGAKSPNLRRDPKDVTPKILSGIAHGSISLLGSLVIFVLFPESLFANFLGITRFVIPVIILFTTQDPIVKTNAKQATNYVLTCLILMVAIALIGWLVVLGLIAAFIAFWPLFILVMLPVVAYSIALSIWPLIAFFTAIQDQGKEFYYPNWLIIHFL